MISRAFAQSTTKSGTPATDHAERFFEAPEFWVAVAFVVLIAAVIKPVWRIVTSTLDARIDAIRDRLDEATRLREEAQDLLASYKRKLAEAENEAEGIISEARDEAQALRERMTEELEHSLKRREQQALDRIAQAEIDATAEVRARTVDIAIEATRRILAETATGDKADELINGAIRELPEKLN